MLYFILVVANNSVHPMQKVPVVLCAHRSNYIITLIFTILCCVGLYCDGYAGQKLQLLLHGYIWMDVSLALAVALYLAVALALHCYTVNM